MEIQDFIEERPLQLLAACLFSIGLLLRFEAMEQFRLYIDWSVVQFSRREMILQLRQIRTLLGGGIGWPRCWTYRVTI